MSKYALINAEIHTMDSDLKVINKGQIIIENGTISAIGENLHIPEDAEIIDVHGGFLMPGLIDAHCHIGLYEPSIGNASSGGNEAVNPVTPELRAIDGINPRDPAFNEALMSGVTMVCTGPGSANVIGGTFATLKTYGKTLDSMIVNPCTAMKIAFGENPKRVYGEQKKSPTTKMAIAATLRESLFKAKAYLNKENKEFDMKMDALSKVLTGELFVKAHAHRADDIVTAIRIAKEFGLTLSIEHCTEGYMITDELKTADIKSILLGPNLSFRTKIETQNSTFKSASILEKEGFDVAIITDHPVIPLKNLMICAAMAAREGLDCEEALKCVTINAAKAINEEKRTGSLKVGKDADILVYSGHPFDLRNTLNFISVNGEIIKNEF